MSFKSAVVLTAPDADPTQHHAYIETPKYELTVVVVEHGNMEQAVEVCKTLADDGVQSIILCPAFSHQGVARIAQAVGKDVAINASRGDTPSTMTASRHLKQAGWF